MNKKNYQLNCWCTNKKNSVQIDHRNWGDDINMLFLPELFEFNASLYDKKINQENYICIGSILKDAYVNNSSIIWGAGAPYPNILQNKPKAVFAVRGPLTRKVLLNSKIDCPEIYGDPALLINQIYRPIINKKYKIGIIPHFSNINKFINNSDIHLIKFADYNKWTDIIDDIASCEYIVSESLHGLIVAEMLGIKNIWTDFGYNYFKINSYFKYHDFFQSIGNDRKEPKIINNVTKINVDDAILTWDGRLDLTKLYNVNPFKI